MGDEPARSTETFYRHAVREIFRCQKFLQIRTKVFFGLGQHAGGNLFAANFK